MATDRDNSSVIEYISFFETASFYARIDENARKKLLEFHRNSNSFLCVLNRKWVDRRAYAAAFLPVTALITNRVATVSTAPMTRQITAFWTKPAMM